MPTVPRYSQPQVQQAPLSGQKFEGKLPEDNSYKIIEALGNLGETGMKTAQEVKNHNDKIPVTEADMNFQNFMNDEQIGEDGFMKVKGKDALQIEEAYGARMKKKFDEISNSLANDDQRYMFKQRADRVMLNQRYKMAVYAQGEEKDYNVSLHKANIETHNNSSTLNYGDEKSFKEHQEKSNESYDALVRLGVIDSQEQADLMKYNNTSGVRLGAVGRILDDNNPFMAERYIQMHEKEFNADDLGKAKAHVKDKLLTAKGEMYSNQIFAQEGYTGKSAAYARASQIAGKDTELRDRIMHGYAIKAALAEEDDQNKLDQLSIDASKVVDEGGNYRDKMSADQLGQFSPELKSALDHRMLVKAGAEPKQKPDPEKVQEYTSIPLAMLGRVPYADMLKNVAPYATDDEWKKLRANWELSRTALKGDKNAQNKIAGVQEWKDVLFRSMRDYKVAGLNADSVNDSSLTPQQKKAFERLQDDFDDKYRAYEAQHGGKNPDANALRTIADEVVKYKHGEVMRVKTFFGDGNPKSAADLKNMTEAEKNKSFVSFDSLSRDQINRMVNVFKANNIVSADKSVDDVISLIKNEAGDGPMLKDRMQKAAAQAIMGNTEAIKNKLLGK